MRCEADGGRARKDWILCQLRTHGLKVPSQELNTKDFRDCWYSLPSLFIFFPSSDTFRTVLSSERSIARRRRHRVHAARQSNRSFPTTDDATFWTTSTCKVLSIPTKSTELTAARRGGFEATLRRAVLRFCETCSAFCGDDRTGRGCSNTGSEITVLWP